MEINGEKSDGFRLNLLCQFPSKDILGDHQVHERDVAIGTPHSVFSDVCSNVLVYYGPAHNLFVYNIFM